MIGKTASSKTSSNVLTSSSTCSRINLWTWWRTSTICEGPRSTERSSETKLRTTHSRRLVNFSCTSTWWKTTSRPWSIMLSVTFPSRSNSYYSKTWRSCYRRIRLTCSTMRRTALSSDSSSKSCRWVSSQKAPFSKRYNASTTRFLRNLWWALGLIPKSALKWRKARTKKTLRSACWNRGRPSWTTTAGSSCCSIRPTKTYLMRRWRNLRS